MVTECTEARLEFQGLGQRKVVAGFDGGTVTSDAGALLLREAERATKVVERFAKGFVDHRDSARVEHPLESLIKQRVFGLCLGYEDLNDHDIIRRDPVLSLLCGVQDVTGQGRRRERDRGAALAGKSTLNRLELSRPNATSEDRYCKIAWSEQAIEDFFMETFLQAHSKPPEKIFLDFDTTDIPLHGEQEERHFHSYYDEYCYLPLYVFSGDFVLMAMLRAAYVEAAFEIVMLLEPLLEQIRARWPEVQIVLRGDSAFCRDELMAMVEQRKAAGEKIDYVIGLPGNSRLLSALAEPMDAAKKQYEQTKQKARVFAEFDYQTLETWSQARRVVGKAEHNEQGANPRFVVTSLPRTDFEAQAIYEQEYCGRGQSENCHKEQQLGLFADRTSSSSFSANQLRLYFSAAAYTLMNELRRVGLAGTELARAQCCTIREKLLKVGARVLLSVRRIRLMMASSYPWQHLFGAALENLRVAYPVLRL